MWTEGTGLTPDARPQLVLIGDLSRSDVAAREAAVFGAARMQLAARVFRHVHVSPADAARDARLAGYPADSPVLLVVTPDATKAFADDLPSIVTAAERTQAAIAAVDAELQTIASTPLTAADRGARVAAATARRDALVLEFRAHFVLHARTLARS